MSNRAIILALLAVLLGLGGWWFSQYFGFGPQRVWVGYSGEARVNPFFAARLLLEHLGFKVDQKADFHKLGALPPGATLILAADRAELNPPDARALLSWVERDGGHLIVGAQRNLPRDVLLQQINVEVRGKGGEDAQTKPTAAGVDKIPMPDGSELRADLLPSPTLIDLDEDADTWRVISRGGTRILQFDWGEGDITVLSTLRPFTNREIGRLDHAELLAQVTGASEPGELFLIRQFESVSFLSWLGQHAAAALVALAVFVLVWLWRIVPRFGPLAPSPAPDRKSLLEHIRAVGRFHLDQHELPRLLVLLRADCVELFGRRAPQAQGLDDAARLREAARLSGVRPRELAQAFSGRADTPADFANAVRTLATFRRRLKQTS
jgi:hypothetical protein